jgi:hypothetical protein
LKHKIRHRKPRFLSSIENVRNHYVTTMKIENQKSIQQF